MLVIWVATRDTCLQPDRCTGGMFVSGVASGCGAADRMQGLRSVTSQASNAHSADAIRAHRAVRTKALAVTCSSGRCKAACR